MGMSVILDLPTDIYRMIEEAARVEEKSIPHWIIAYIQLTLTMSCSSDFALDFWPVSFSEKDVKYAFESWAEEQGILTDY